MKKAKISQLIYDNVNFLKALTKIKSQKKLRRLLKAATTQQLLSIAEISLNLVSSRFELTTRQKKRLIPFADFIRRMSRLRSETGARKLIIQKGSGSPGFFAALLTPILVELARQLNG